MVIGSTLCQLGRFLDDWAGDVASVRSVTVSDEAGLGAGESITAEVTLEMPIVVSGGGDRMVGCTPSVSDGVLELRLETGLSALEETAADAVELEPIEATPHTDGTATVTVQLTVSGLEETYADEMAADGHPTGPQVRRSDGPEGAVREPDTGTESGAETRDIPPFRDPELLQEVYEAHDTFAEMADALEMDVTGETVRRYMIDHDIHQPNSYRANSSASTAAAESTAGDDAEEMVVLPDGIGLPDGVSPEDLIETVSRSNTIYEVKEDLGIDRMEAHALLKELDMVDLVLGRLSNDTGRDITREDVVERLREVSQAQTH